LLGQELWGEVFVDVGCTEGAVIVQPEGGGIDKDGRTVTPQYCSPLKQLPITFGRSYLKNWSSGFLTKKNIHGISWAHSTGMVHAEWHE
jgi:hypothetical protein